MKINEYSERAAWSPIAIIREWARDGMPKAFKYLASQKLSNFQIETIIKEYARGLSATTVLERSARSPGRSRSANTVFEIFALLRARLTEIGYYPSPEEYIRYWKLDPEARLHSGNAINRAIVEQAARLRGMAETTVRDHTAELIFRANHPGIHPDTLFREIRTAIKITGPLNRPPVNLDMWRSRSYIITLNRQIAELRARMDVNPEGHKKIIAQLELVIAEEARRYRREARRIIATRADDDI